MVLNELVQAIDAEIARLTQARVILAEGQFATPAVTRRGRPSGSTLTIKKPKKKRNLSPEGRARIAEAVKRRWAAQKAKQKKA